MLLHYEVMIWYYQMVRNWLSWNHCVVPFEGVEQEVGVEIEQLWDYSCFRFLLHRLILLLHYQIL